MCQKRSKSKKQKQPKNGDEVRVYTLLKNGWNRYFVHGCTPPALILHDDLPDWAQDNEHLMSGYRPCCASYQHCIDSLFYLHNETCNVYTHGIPFLFGWMFSLYTIVMVLPQLGASFGDCLAFLPLVIGTLNNSSKFDPDKYNVN